MGDLLGPTTTIGSTDTDVALHDGASRLTSGDGSEMMTCEVGVLRSCESGCGTSDEP
jgi:hypothetical protein